jgi:hypothetical protein
MGLVLVFDMDQTLIDTSDGIKERPINDNTIPDIKNALNYKLIEEVLRPAAILRSKGEIDAIVMLTNTSKKCFAAYVSYVLSMILDSESKYNCTEVNPTLDCSFHDTGQTITQSFFDYIMWSDPTRRKKKDPRSKEVSKDLDDVRLILKDLSIGDDNLAERVFFFDDRSDHLMGDELKSEGFENHYVKISPREKDPGFKKDGNSTNYSAPMKALKRASHLKNAPGLGILGGSRKKRKSSKTRKLLKKIR